MSKEAKMKKKAWDASELEGSFRETQDIRGFLDQVVIEISSHLDVQACSLYLYDESKSILILQATNGLNKERIGTLSITENDGLTGKTLKELKPIIEADSKIHPESTSFTGSGDDKFSSFLAVPITKGKQRIGVMVLHDEESGRFNQNYALDLQAITYQISSTLENIQILISKHPGKSGIKPHSDNRFIRGTTVVEGIALGKAYHFEGRELDMEMLFAEGAEYGDTLEAFRQAITRSEEQLEALQTQLSNELADVASLIFNAHLLMLRDEVFSGAMEELIKAGQTPCEAVTKVVNEYMAIFSGSENTRMKEKVLDIKDLGHRILKNLIQGQAEEGDYSGQIVLTNELLPSEFLKLAAQKVEGIVLLGATATAHVTVLAHSLQVPLIYTENEALFRIPPNTDLVLDGFQGILFINPDESVVKRVIQLKEGTDRLEELKASARENTCTADGERIYLQASVNLLSDLAMAKELKADGIGLYRSEFPFLIRSDFPTEEEQYQIYKQVTEKMSNGKVILRTLDVGGDKILSYLPDAKEANPFLGQRAIRFLLDNKKIFVGQLKAMIRAAGPNQHANILFPLVSSVDEIKNVRKYVEKSLRILKGEEKTTYPAPKLGAMIELPSAVVLVHEFARAADFLSVGTNDLVQYMLGVDRTNEKVADLFDILHPAVLRAIKQVAEAARQEQCPVSICGIMTRDVRTVYYMIGLGLRSFSLPPGKLPGMQHAVSQMNLKAAQRDAEAISKMATSAEIRQYLNGLKLPETTN